jgi:hypothetical protein
MKADTGSNRLTPPTFHEWDRMPWAVRAQLRRCIPCAGVAINESGVANQGQLCDAWRAVAWPFPIAPAGQKRSLVICSEFSLPARLV